MKFCIRFLFKLIRNQLFEVEVVDKYFSSLSSQLSRVKNLIKFIYLVHIYESIYINFTKKPKEKRKRVHFHQNTSICV